MRAAMDTAMNKVYKRNHDLVSTKAQEKKEGKRKKGKETGRG